jgi:hypothetical protein
MSEKIKNAITSILHLVSILLEIIANIFEGARILVESWSDEGDEHRLNARHMVEELGHLVEELEHLSADVLHEE